MILDAADTGLRKFYISNSQCLSNHFKGTLDKLKVIHELGHGYLLLGAPVLPAVLPLVPGRAQLLHKLSSTQ